VATSYRRTARLGRVRESKDAARCGQRRTPIGTTQGGVSIARIWKGAVRQRDGNDYADYLRETGISGYAGTPGNRGVWMLRRDIDGNTEFLMFTLWDSLDSVKAFAGEDYETAVFYPEDDRFLVECDLLSTHYVVDTHASPPG
jgi:heme-degrading monooxygenase HmoA